MQPITLHPVSLLFGAALVGAFMLVSSAMQAPAVTQGGAVSRPVSQVPLTIDNDVSVLGVPNPKTAVVIRVSAPYTVPSGKRLVLTAFGLSSLYNNKSASLIIDGVTEVEGYCAAAQTLTGGPILQLSMSALPSPLVVQAGHQVSVAGPDDYPRAWGYLIDA